MNTSIYTVVSVFGLVFVLDQIVGSILTLDKISDLIVDTYNKERKLRLYGEVLGLRNNVEDAYYYIESKRDSEDGTNLDLERNRYLLEFYLDSIDSFLDKNESFRYLSIDIDIDQSYRYTVIEHKQKNPELDRNYPNWYFRFCKEN